MEPGCLMKDTETNTLIGAYQKNGLFIAISGSMREQKALHMPEQLAGSARPFTRKDCYCQGTGKPV